MKKFLFLSLSLFLSPAILNAQTITYSGSNVGIGSAAPGQVLDVQGTVRALAFSGPLTGYYPYIKISNTQTSGTGGGTATLGSWNSCVFNTKDTDTAGIATLSSNQITLPAGTYLTHIMQVTYRTAGFQIRLQNITDSSTTLIGFTTTDAPGDNTSTQSEIVGTFTISASKTFAIQYQSSATEANIGLGANDVFGTEVYATGEFTKIN